MLMQFKFKLKKKCVHNYGLNFINKKAFIEFIISYTIKDGEKGVNSLNFN